ncbi:squalene epoxidase family protein [Burkholderia thailandensis E264]|uniref:Monooxygenase family protein n=2 Tax=Burkholderia thailandensis TaxID=57975 RepID=Q2T4X8_BURTA|nr:FAD-dependent monooxygenase [Burkholderia thailandensis]ABC34930.1 monooxygenase family protein [Burkholderia thailandensis E264]AHI75073.1 squalene epoxidase family protein [Burkholderia thailandensis 2002721723]AIP28974.1 squalene epoxidase family protein [Burkholderia thailandensis E264]AJY02509.1 squalene epoxidase family protein [Burkholderia thailandensis 2002721643]NBC92300.1 monooxygenase [Burkholderia thailandensis]
MKNNQVDVLINGSGIAGVALAHLLGTRGHGVTVVERAACHRAQNGADLLKPSGIGVVRKMGLLDDVIAAGGLRRDAMKLFHDKELIASLDYRTSSALGFFILIPCEQLRRLLLAKLDVMPNVRLRFETSIERIEQDADGTVTSVVLSDGETVAPKALVGADGARSMIRSDVLRVPAERVPYATPMAFGTIALTDSVRECNRLYVDSNQGLAYFYPIGDEATRLVVSFPADDMQDYLADATRAKLVARLSEFVGDESADAMAAIGAGTEFPLIPLGRMNLDRYHKRNVVVLGDAAHSIHPITGQGMNLAIEDAGELGECLDQHLSGRIALADALDRFERIRHPVNEAVISYGHALATTYHDRAALVANFRSQLQTSGRDAALLGTAAEA